MVSGGAQVGAEAIAVFPDSRKGQRRDVGIVGEGVGIKSIKAVHAPEQEFSVTGQKGSAQVELGTLQTFVDGVGPETAGCLIIPAQPVSCGYPHPLAVIHYHTVYEVSGNALFHAIKGEGILSP